MTDWNDMALVGWIARPHGLKGDVVIAPETDFAKERFQSGAVLWTRSPQGEEALTIVSARMHNGRAIVGFEGLSRIEDAERLAGRELRVPEDALYPLEAGRYYEYQLVGCTVERVSGEPVGTVARVEGGAGGSRLVIDGVRGEIQVPLATHICVEVDVAGKRILIDPPEGLLELNIRSRQ